LRYGYTNPKSNPKANTKPNPGQSILAHPAGITAMPPAGGLMFYARITTEILCFS